MPGLKKSELLKEMAELGFFDAYEYYKRKWSNTEATIPSQAHYRVLLVLYALNCTKWPLKVPQKVVEADPTKKYTDPRAFWNVVEILYNGCNTTFKARFSELLDQTNYVAAETGEYYITEEGIKEAIKQIRGNGKLRRFWIRLYNLIWGTFENTNVVRQVLKATGNWHPLQKSKMLSLFRRED